MLVPREPFCEELIEITDVKIGVPSAQRHDGDRDLAPPRVGAPDDRQPIELGLSGEFAPHDGRAGRQC